jgi:hypothetical protein
LRAALASRPTIAGRSPPSLAARWAGAGRHRRGVDAVCQPAGQQRKETGQRERLAEVVVHPFGQVHLLFVHHGVRRHGDDRQGRKAGQRPDPAGGREAVDDRHLDVHQNQVESPGRRLAEDVDRLLAVLGERGTMPTLPSRSKTISRLSA